VHIKKNLQIQPISNRYDHYKKPQKILKPLKKPKSFINFLILFKLLELVLQFTLGIKQNIDVNAIILILERKIFEINNSLDHTLCRKKKSKRNLKRVLNCLSLLFIIQQYVVHFSMGFQRSIRVSS
jgi:hypothetical protein